MDNFSVIYKILRYLEKAMDFDEPDLDCISAERLKITGNRRDAILEMLVREGYVDGVTIKRSVDGESVMSLGHVRITLKGLEYLKENSIMKKLSDAAKGIADIIS